MPSQPGWYAAYLLNSMTGVARCFIFCSCCTELPQAALVCAKYNEYFMCISLVLCVFPSLDRAPLVACVFHAMLPAPSMPRPFKRCLAASDLNSCARLNASHIPPTIAHRLSGFRLWIACGSSASCCQQQIHTTPSHSKMLRSRQVCRREGAGKNSIGWHKTRTHQCRPDQNRGALCVSALDR